MKNNPKNKKSRLDIYGLFGATTGATSLWTTAVFLVVFMALGCSRTTAPPVAENQGTIALRLTLDPTAIEELSQRSKSHRPDLAPLALDSVVVRVFRPGAGNVLETYQGVAIGGSASEVDVTVTCRAEAHKKVSVELFDRRRMMFFGVEENVTVETSKNTQVVIEAWDIYLDYFILWPEVLAPTELFGIAWSGVPAATAYGVQESTTEDFDDVVWETVTTDTLLFLTRNVGAHYFRVVPLNPYVVGSVSEVKYCYVTDGTEPPQSISRIDPPGAPPGDEVTITGVNLDLPGTLAYIGAVQCPIISCSETEMVIHIPLNGRSEYVRLWNILDQDFVYSPVPLSVERIAYVSSSGTGGVSDGYVDLIATADPVVADASGVALVSLKDLDERDMSVFDVIILARDTGTLSTEWGGDHQRAMVVDRSGAQVLAIGEGGAAYLQQANSLYGALSASIATQYDLQVLDNTLPIFTEPYSVSLQAGNMLRICFAPDEVAAFRIGGVVPQEFTLHAARADLSEEYPLMDAAEGVSPETIRDFLWGYNGNPADLTNEARYCFLNVIHLLVNTSYAVPLQTADRISQ